MCSELIKGGFMNNQIIKTLLKDLDIDNKNGIIEILEDLNEGILIVDKDYSIIYYNDNLADIESLEAKNVIGKNLFEVFPDKSIGNSTIYQSLNEGTKVIDKLEKYFTYQGNQVSVLNTTIPLYKDGEIIAALDLSKDLSHYNKLLKTSNPVQTAIGQSSNNKNVLKYCFDDIITHDPEMIRTISFAARASKQSSNILIIGETGTGKELFAQSIHNESLRQNHPFIALNCAAIPGNLMESILFGTAKGSYTGAVEKAGLFEQANKGTLLLDEINSMSINLQAKLLRVLQEGTFRRIGGDKEIQTDVRVIATTNDNLLTLVHNKSFRLDLYYRLSVISINIPPLRNRKCDIRLLAQFFLNSLSIRMSKSVIGFSEEVIQMYNRSEWIGNVRELRNIVESSLCLVENETHIALAHTPDYLKNHLRDESYAQQNDIVILDSHAISLSEQLSFHEKTIILNALKAYNNNITKAADSLAISRQSLQYRMRKLSITKDDFKLIHKDDL